MEAGKLRHRVTIKAPTEARDETGHVIESGSTTLATRWAEVVPLSSKEAEHAKAIYGEVSHRVRLRHLDGVTSKHFVEFNGRRLQLAGPPINTDERGIELVLMCREIAA